MIRKIALVALLWVCTIPVVADILSDVEALAEAVYHEARGETELGQLAVALVILERVKSKSFPNTIVKVVHQQRRGTCQFSYYCDGRSDKMLDTKARYRVLSLATALLDGEYGELSIGNADHFYNPDKVREPYWVKSMHYVGQFGNHKFYRSQSNK